MTHPLEQLFEWFPDNDFAVLEHGFAEHGRDYRIMVETQFGAKPGRHWLIFTHTVEASLVTTVRDDVWLRSWSDEFINYQTWLDAGEPDGFVWGSNWSLAYPGFEKPVPTDRARGWSERVKHPMHEAVVETDRFRLTLVFHDIRTEKLDDRTDIVSQVIIPFDD